MRLCRWSIIALTGIAAVAVMRCVIVFVPQTLFDVDPASNPSPIAGLAMGGSLMLDVLLLCFCAVGFIAIARSGNQRWHLVLLALLPLPVILHHGFDDAGDIWRGATWVAAVLAAVVVAHLARQRTLRIVLAALLMAVIAPLLLRGTAQMTYEHADKIAAFEQRRETFLRERGWEQDSPAAQIFERRLRQPQPLGWFFTTNIYASGLVVAAVVLGGITLAIRRAKLPSGWMGFTGLLALACIFMVCLSGSRGAMLALLAGLTLCLLPLAASRVRPLLARFGPQVLLVLVAMAILGVVTRGLLLPESFLDERSLLFRWHYLISAAEAFAQNPLLGVGPDGFQEAHMRFRLPRNPEEVISAHAVFADWAATLGILAVAWIALVVGMLWKAGGALRVETPDLTEDDRKRLMAFGLPIAGIVAVTAMGAGIAAEVHVLDDISLFLRTMNIVGYVGLAAALIWMFARIDGRFKNWSLAAAATALVVHGQIEMTFFLHGSVVWAMCVVGLAAAGGGDNCCAGSSTQGRWVCYAASGLIAVTAVVVLITGALPALTQQRLMQEAANVLHPPAQTRDGQMRQRTASAEELVRAYAAWRINPLPLQAATRQYETAAMIAADPATRDAMLEQAIATADRLVAEHPSHEAFSARTALHARYAMLHDDDAAWQRAIDDARAVVERDPHGNMSWLMLGDHLWSSGRLKESAEAYERALRADDKFELDPLKRMPQRRREVVIQRLNEARGD